jgi:hypothetical protein
MLIIAKFIINIKHDQDEACNSNGKSQEVNECVNLPFNETPDQYFEEVLDH